MPLLLPSFPFLSPTEFKAACVSFEERYRNHRRRDAGNVKTGLGIGGWRDVRVYEREGQTVLAVLKSVDASNEKCATATKREDETKVEEVEDEIEDDDPVRAAPLTSSTEEAIGDEDESLVRQPNLNAGRELDVEYSILLSPTYQVPVLYFSLIDRRTGIPRPAAGGLDAVYDQFVPAQFRTGLRDVGVLGGISVGNHPVSGIPTYFVHPCNTADALRDVADPKSMPNTDTYLLLWLGLVGGCVDLPVPRALASETETEMESR